MPYNLPASDLAPKMIEYSGYIRTSTVIMIKEFYELPLDLLYGMRNNDPMVNLHNGLVSQLYARRNSRGLSTNERWCIIRIQSDAIGLDETQHEFVNLILPHILPVITYIFNSVLNSSILPIHKSAPTF